MFLLLIRLYCLHMNLQVPLEVLQNVIRPEEMQPLVQLTSSSDQLAVGNWSIWESGEWWMLLAAQSMAVGTVMVRWVSKFSDPIMATGWVSTLISTFCILVTSVSFSLLLKKLKNIAFVYFQVK